VAQAQTQPARPGLDPSTDQEQRVTPLELFFDLVFVLSFTQVTASMAEHPTWTGIGEGLLILAAVWWAWAAYGWLTNAIDADENVNRLCMFAAMAAMLLVSLAIPEAFGAEGLLFAGAYLFVRAMHLILYVRNTRREGDQDNLGAILGLAPGFLFSSLLFVVGGALEGDARVVIWTIAVLADYATPLVFGNENFRLHPGHFAERHGLIVIIAFGESIVAIGAGASEIELTGRVVLAATLGFAVTAALWWTYFDDAHEGVERRLHDLHGRTRNTTARDAYSFLHLPMVAGIVLLALGVKKTLGHVDDPLEVVPAIALCGGTALYLVAQVAFRMRCAISGRASRLLTAAACAALVPLATETSALIALAAIAAVCAGLVAFETARMPP
jgi:low temperature requirement protein LtrA